MSENMVDDSRITAIGLLTEVYTGLSTRFASHLEQHGLSLAEFEVLMRLSRSPDRQLRMTDLAAQTSLSTSGVTRLVDRMERDSLICRRACPSDRRSSYATLTATGTARLNEALPGHLALIEQWFTSRLDAESLDGLLRALRTVRDAVNPGAVSGSVDRETSPCPPARPPGRSSTGTVG